MTGAEAGMTRYDRLFRSLDVFKDGGHEEKPAGLVRGTAPNAPEHRNNL